MNLLDIELVSVSKTFANMSVVKDINLAVPQGEFVSILGPSGCGKTTTLNMIAGFNAPSCGDIRVRGRSQIRVPPERRNIGLVFQNYALFPHMTVNENVAFGLKMKGAGSNEIALTVKDALRSVHLEGYGERYPRELSGGQQQRVALARAIAPRPSVLLLDEPLSNLDLKLREAMRIELKEIHEQLGMTFVYVTHDQEEAMAMSDRIVVMSQGSIAQEGTPAQIYRDPKSRFVADFIGKSNILAVSDVKPNGKTAEIVVGNDVRLIARAPDDDRPIRYCSIRPESVSLGAVTASGEDKSNRINAVVRRVINLGGSLEVLAQLSEELHLHILVRSSRSTVAPAVGETVALGIDAADIQTLAE
ncbi:Spermidine/putrescine import ATP-binding protein PotA [Ensifer adhaerens]|uniref:ABC transporter ATP-binding protein n=1 Tax=Ensifer adhaerens TaxID=106592 RepID=UPI001568D29A|nr:ABC transporter ATP-binding protein [Ensifer adhaerens]NRP21828.1 Spermidine/putrescine import ATP-binding protein PotA [Ensifer adhaerens]